MRRKRQDVMREASRSIWKEAPGQCYSFYCPLCKSSRNLKMHPHAGHIRHFAQVGITTILLSALVAHFVPWIGWKTLVCFVPLWIAFETVYRARVRTSAACQHCGFDPFLYLSDPKRARNAIRDHWRRLYEEKGLEFPEETPANAAHAKAVSLKAARRESSRAKNL